MDTPTMPELFTTVVTAVWSQVTTCMTTISGNALLLLSVCVPFVGAVIGLAKRFLRFGGGRRR